MKKTEAGLTPRGKPMPQTREELKHLADLYANVIIGQRAELGKLRAEVNNLRQKKV